MRGTVEMLLVICFAKLSLFFLPPFSLSSGGPVCEGVAAYES